MFLRLRAMLYNLYGFSAFSFYVSSRVNEDKRRRLQDVSAF